MTDPTEAIREAHEKLTFGIEIIKKMRSWTQDGYEVPIEFHHAARNLKYALDAMAPVDARFFVYRFEYADGSAFEVFVDGRAFIVFKDGRREEKTGKITNRIPAAIRSARALVDAKEEGK